MQRSLRIARISASVHYQGRQYRNVELRREIVRLAHRHKRYGAGMIGLKLRQSGWRINHKRIERLYAQAGLLVRRPNARKYPPVTGSPCYASARRTRSGRWISCVIEQRMVRCLNEHWFVCLGHAKTIIEAWRQEYNNERPKKSLGGLTPAAHARQLAEANTVWSATGL